MQGLSAAGELGLYHKPSLIQCPRLWVTGSWLQVCFPPTVLTSAFVARPESGAPRPQGGVQR